MGTYTNLAQKCDGGGCLCCISPQLVHIISSHSNSFILYVPDVFTIRNMATTQLVSVGSPFSSMGKV